MYIKGKGTVEWDVVCLNININNIEFFKYLRHHGPYYKSFGYLMKSY